MSSNTFADIKYSARMTGNQFLYNEFKQVVRLICSGLSQKEIQNKVTEENLFEYKTTKAVPKRVGATYERASYLDEDLKGMVLSEPNEVGRVINLYSIMKYDVLFTEFMEEVINEKIYTNQLVLEKSDITNFLSIKAEQSEIVASFKESSLKRLRLAYIEVLEGAGYLNKVDKVMKLNIPTAAYRISNYLESIGEKRFAKALIGE